MEDEDMIQIDELMQPSSPAYKNRELKELFGKRMDEILLPRGTYPFQRRGGTDSKILPMAR
ncbi:hypothetical protein M408DRAFT_26003 [Serendipita vermifera MAFF 305830]|uniref:Uncharacterized protein n=1 Tax=Serendipita vermifera MAFF 305830 TaxID=933852 RepID=A0A0C2WH19_SERVB|nr:hypothetical protein M408DRAFT_26003 [Serendipita vermifera MAFF 305830]